MKILLLGRGGQVGWELQRSMSVLGDVVAVDFDPAHNPDGLCGDFTDLAGLATGGGIGVLATVKNVEPGDVSLIAPLGAVDAGDAGIRSSGNLSIAAAQVLNAGNIAVAGTSAGTPAAAPAAPAVSSAAPPPPPPTNKNPAAEAAQANNAAQQEAVGAAVPVSEVTVEVLGYGGSEDPVDQGESAIDDEEKKRRRRLEAEQDAAVSPDPQTGKPDSTSGQ